MSRPADLTQWRDHTEEPVIIWAYTGVWELMPVAVDAVGPEADEYDQVTRAWYAAGCYYTLEELEQEHADSLTPAQIEELYSRGDGSAEATLPTNRQKCRSVHGNRHRRRVFQLFAPTQQRRSLHGALVARAIQQEVQGGCAQRRLRPVRGWHRKPRCAGGSSA